MFSKRILLFSLLFSVLAFSLFYHVFLNVLHSLRIDPIPAGTYIVPWMRPSPPILQLSETFNIDAVMAGALKLPITFRIDIPNGTRVIPSTVYLGHDTDYLYVGGKFIGMHSNPASEPNGWAQPNFLNILFDTTNTGVLKTPESGSRLDVYIDVPAESLVGVSYSDMIWVYEPDVYKRMIWMPAENYLGPQKGQTVFSIAAQACEYDNSTGTVTMLFARFLSRPGNIEVNALQMRHGERWVMGFLLELVYSKTLDHMVDGWPKKAYPYLSDDCSWWPKLAIDLTNPPPTFSATSFVPDVLSQRSL